MKTRNATAGSVVVPDFEMIFTEKSRSPINLIKLFKSDKSDQVILDSIEAEKEAKRDAWCEFLHRAEMNEDEGFDEGFREETMRAENQMLQAHILETYQSVWSSILEKKKATEKSIY